MKTIEDTKGSFEIALAISVKNKLHNGHGYNLTQLDFGSNSNLPSFLDYDLPTLKSVSTSEVMESNRNVMHAAGK